MRINLKKRKNKLSQKSDHVLDPWMHYCIMYTKSKKKGFVRFDIYQQKEKKKCRVYKTAKQIASNNIKLIRPTLK